MGQLQLLGKVSEISQVVFNEMSFPGVQLRESRGGGDPTWDGIRELLDAPAGLEEVQEPEASPLTKVSVWADNQGSMSAVEIPSVARVENAVLRGGGAAGVFGAGTDPQGVCWEAWKGAVCVLGAVWGAEA